MAPWINSLYNFLQLNLLHLRGARKRIFLLLITVTTIAAVVLSSIGVRDAYQDELLKSYENKNDMNLNDSPTLRFASIVGIKGTEPWDGLSGDFADLISQHIDKRLEEAKLKPAVSKTLLAIMVRIDVMTEEQNRVAPAYIGGVSDELFAALDTTLTKGIMPTNGSEVIDLGLCSNLGLMVDPDHNTTNLVAFNSEIGFFANQTFHIVGQTDEENVVTRLEALFPRDLLKRAAFWDLLTSIDYLFEFISKFDFFHSRINGYVEIVWNIEKIRVRDIETWEQRARHFETYIEGNKFFLGNSVNFGTNEELSQLISQFRDDKQYFDLTYTILSIPVLILVFLVLLEVNSLGSKSQVEEIELLYLNGVSLSEVAIILIIDRLMVVIGSLILGTFFSPLFSFFSQIFLPESSSWLNPIHLLLNSLQFQIYIFLGAFIFLASLPNIISSLHEANSIQESQEEKESVRKQSYIILITTIAFAALLMIASQTIQSVSGSDTNMYAGIDFIASNTALAAVSAFLIATPPLLIRFLDTINGKIGARIWKSHMHRKLLAFQLFREDSKYFARSALVLLLTLTILVPSLIVSPSINSHLEGESRLVVGSTLLIDNWIETIPTDAVLNASPRIVETSLVHHIILKGRFPPLYEYLSILAIDPFSFASVAHLSTASKDQLISLESVRQLAKNETLLLGSNAIRNPVNSNSVSFTGWETKRELNLTHYIPHEISFQIIAIFNLFPLLTIETRSALDARDGVRFDELVMSQENWMNLANIAGLDSKISWTAHTKLLVKLDDESAQKQVATKLQQAFGKPVTSIGGVKGSFANPFHEFYRIISFTSLLGAFIVILVIGIISANILLNQRKKGFEILLRRGMPRREVTLIAVEEFGIAMILPMILGIGFGVAFLFSIGGTFSIYSDLLSFTWLWKPLEFSVAILAVVIGAFLIWTGSFVTTFYFYDQED